MVTRSYTRSVLSVTSGEQVDVVLDELKAKCTEWHELPDSEKVALLKKSQARLLKASLELGNSVAKVRTLRIAYTPGFAPFRGVACAEECSGLLFFATVYSPPYFSRSSRGVD
jgi:hypothetical protein